MISAFLYLTVCSVRNRVRVRLRRLKQPRYLIGSIVGGLYLYSVVFRNVLRLPSRARAVGPLAALSRFRSPVEFMATMLLVVTAVGAWIMPGAGRPIEFSRSEVQFLFQAPLSRRQLIHYKLLRGQLGVLFGSAVATLFLRPGSFAIGWTFLVGTWLVLAICRLHFIGVALRRQSLAHHGTSGWRRQWLPLTIVLGGLAVLVASVWRDWPVLSVMATAGQVFEELQHLASTGAAAWVLWPFRVLVRLPLAGSGEAFLQALPAVLALLAVNYVWVLRGDASFEEASAAYAERRALMRTPQGRSRTPVRPTRRPFELGESGRPEIAILWKNLISLGRYASARLLIVVPMFILLAVSMSRRGTSGGIVDVVATMSFVFSVMAVLLGPQIIRNDLRQDLANLAVLKTWPIRGTDLIRGELLAPATVLTVVAWLFIAVAAVLNRVPGIAGVSPWSIAAAALVIAPAIIAAQLIVQNGIAVIFPAWIAVGSSRARGVDAMGQRLLMMAGILLALGVSLLPGALLAAAVAFGIYAVTHVVPIVIPTAIVALVVFAECFLAIEALGRVLDRTDVSALEPTD